MTQIIELTPTAFEVAHAKLAARTPKEIAREQKRCIKTLMNAYAFAYHKGTAGHQYAELCKVADYCQREQIETPMYVAWMLLLHREATL